MTKAERREKLLALGPKPPMWRPFARRRWQRKFDAIMALDSEELAELYRKLYNIASMKRLAEHKHPLFQSIKKEP